MEIEVSGNSKIILNPGSKTEFGRVSGILTDDRTVSRHHVSFEVPLTTSDVSKVRFEVIGRNPIWVHCSKNGKVNTFTSTQIGELEVGDKFCVSAKTPNWFTLRRKAEFCGQIEDKKQDFDENLVGLCELIDCEDSELESIDVASIDPVKEFGFLVLGHEFDRYPKRMIRDMKDWDWFIDEPVMENDDDDEYEKRKRIRRGKRKKGDENDDDEWTVESEDETEQISKVQKVPKPKYTTRSKGRGNRGKEEAGKDLHLKQKSRATSQKVKDDDEEDDTDEDDETLGGFIIDDELEHEEETDDNEDEEEFEDEDDDEDE